MSDWILVPCLVTLRAEFNAVAPNRDRGADGSIGDTAHQATGTSDHLPDEDTPYLRDRDADSRNEVHGLDIDSSGPWPGGWAWFDAAVKGIVDRHRRGEDDRLEYVIWNRKIASRSRGWVWRTYTGTADPHTGHAHFSSRYTTAQESDTKPWGIEDDMTPDQLITALNSDAGQAAIAKAAGKGVHNQILFRSDVTIGAAIRGANDKATALVSAVAAIPDATVAELGDTARSIEEQAALLRAVLGDRAPEIGRLLAGQAS